MREIKQDKEKAKALMKMADKIEERIQKTDVEEFPSQVLLDYYDILHNLMEGISSTHGLKSEGRGAHKKLIDWVTSEYDLSESERRFLDQVRQYRNRITYEGFTLNPGYLKRNKERLEEITGKLREILKKGID